MTTINELDQERIDNVLIDFFDKQKYRKIARPELLPYESAGYESALIQIFDVVINSRGNSDGLSNIMDILLEAVNFDESIYREPLEKMGNTLKRTESGGTYIESRNYKREQLIKERD